VAATSHAPTSATGTAPPAAAKAAKAAQAPTSGKAKPSAQQSRRPIADILPSISGMPRWLEDVLLAAGLMAAAAYATEPVAVFARRRRQRHDQQSK
jgi:predicted flap endonuclease-1-like 5' DNA nuclease